MNYIIRTASYLSLFVAVTLLVLPLVFTAWGSFINIQGVMAMPPSLLANYTTGNYQQVFEHINLRWPLNTFLLTLMAVGGSVFISALTGYGIVLRSQKWARMLIIAAIVIPRYALVIPQALIMRTLGLVDTLIACALPLVVTPLHIFMAETYFRTFPKSLADAGRVEGLGDFGVLTRVIMPNSKALIVCLSLLKTVEVWNDYLWQYIVLQSDSKRTLLTGMIKWVQTRGQGIIEINPVGISLAVSVVLMLPFLFLFGFGSKYFMYELKGVD